MKKKIIAYIIGILGCLILDAGIAAMAITINAPRPFYDYIIFGVMAFIIDFLFLALVGSILENSGNKCLVIKLPGTVDDDSLPKLR